MHKAASQSGRAGGPARSKSRTRWSWKFIIFCSSRFQRWLMIIDTQLGANHWTAQICCLQRTVGPNHYMGKKLKSHCFYLSNPIIESKRHLHEEEIFEGPTKCLEILLFWVRASMSFRSYFLYPKIGIPIYGISRVLTFGISMHQNCLPINHLPRICHHPSPSA